MSERKNVWQEIINSVEKLRAWRRVGTGALKGLGVLFLAWLLIGFAMPFSFQRSASSRAIIDGKAPRSFWGWHPGVKISALRVRKELVEEARSALSLSASAAALDNVSDKLAWCSAVLANDGELNAVCLMVFAERNYLAKAPLTALAQGLAAMASGSCGGTGSEELAIAASSCGLLDPGERIWLLEATRESLLHPSFSAEITKNSWSIKKLIGHLILRYNAGESTGNLAPDAEKNSAILTLLQQREAFARFLFRPNEYARRVKTMLQKAGRRDYERIRLAELAVVSSWLDGAEGGKEVLGRDLLTDPWLEALELRLEKSSWLKGLNGKEFDPIWTTCLSLTAPLPSRLLKADQLLPSPPKFGFKRETPKFEGTFYDNAQKKEHITRLEIRERLATLKNKGKVLFRLPSIPPLTDEKGRISALGSTLAYMAGQIAAEVPQPEFSAPYVNDFFTDLGAWQLSTIWDGPRKEWLRLRQDSPDSLEGSLMAKDGHWRIQVHLVTGKRRSASLTKEFSLLTLASAPAWLAEAAWRLEGKRINAANAAAMRERWVGSGKDLLEFADVLTSSNLAVHRAKRYRNLYSRCKSPALLRLADFDGKGEGLRGRDLMRKAIDREPWRAYSRSKLASLSHKDGFYISAFLNYINLLESDLGNPWYLRHAVNCLEGAWLYAEADELIRICLEASQHGSNQLLLASDAEINRAWRERGGAFAKTVHPWGWDNVEAGEAQSKKYLDEGAAKAPGDVRFTTQLIRNLRDGGTENDCAELFEKGRAQEHCYPALYRNRLEFLKAKWHGSDEAMFEFARRWKDELPELLYDAHKEMAAQWDDDGNALADKSKSQIGWAKYFSGPGIWTEARESYWTGLRKLPCSGNAWTSLFSRAVWAGKEEEELKALNDFFAQNGARSECRDFALASALNAIVVEKNRMQERRKESPEALIDKAGSKYLLQEPVWKIYESVYHSFILDHPGNDLWTNNFAKVSFQYGKKDASRWAFDHLKQWEELEWTRDEYDKARHWAFQ